MSKITLGDRTLGDCLLDGGLNGRKFYDFSTKRVYSVFGLRTSDGSSRRYGPYMKHVDSPINMNTSITDVRMILFSHFNDREVLDYQE